MHGSVMKQVAGNEKHRPPTPFPKKTVQNVMPFAALSFQFLKCLKPSYFQQANLKSTM